MKQYYPAYYNAFRCIAADCPDSCCQGWDVVIDSDAERFYRTVDGEFGEKLRGAIYTDGDGDRVFRLKDKKKCLFWGEDKLCDIYRTLGEEHLCATCAQFPRIRMEYADFCEHSLALACPEAARLILKTDNAYSSLTQESSAGCEDYDAKLMHTLLKARQKLAESLLTKRPLAERLQSCLSITAQVQEQIEPLHNACDVPYTPDALAALFTQLEYIDERNGEMIVQACRSADFSNQESELTRLALYYLYRYWLNAVDTRNVFAVFTHMIVSVSVISNLSRMNRLTLIEAAQRYSKEVEQSYENLERLFDTFAYESCFHPGNMINLILRQYI